MTVQALIHMLISPSSYWTTQFKAAINSAVHAYPRAQKQFLALHALFIAPYPWLRLMRDALGIADADP